jgi:hypothetical protein
MNPKLFFLKARAILVLALALTVGLLIGGTDGALAGAFVTFAVAAAGVPMSPLLCVVEFPTLLDVAKTDKGSAYDVIDESIHSHAEVNLFPVSTQAETTLEVTVQKGLPGGSTFRRPNEGVLPSKTSFENKRFDMSLVNRRVEVDRDGVYARAKDKARLLVTQSVPQMEKALADIATQIWYGLLSDPNKGFPGLVAQMADDASHVVDVTGTSAKSSVFFLDLRPSSVELVFGAEQTITMGDDWKEETVFLGDDNKRMTALVNQIVGWVGLRLLNVNRAVRIKNIGTASNKTLTDTHMHAALNLCQDELGFTPTHIVGNGRSFEQLRVSRVTSLLPNPPAVTEFAGIPIVRSINISKAETV